MTHRPLLTALALAVFLLPSLAAAEPSDADRATARALAAQAHVDLDAKNYTAAAERFARADELVHAPTLLLGLARAEVGLGKLVAAHEAYARIVREGAPANAPKVFTDAVESARKEGAALEPRLSWVTVNITGAPDAKVTLDGVVIPHAAVGVPRAVDPGAHVAIATADGGAQAQAEVKVGEGKTETVTLALEAAAPGAPPPVVPLTPPPPLPKALQPQPPPPHPTPAPPPPPPAVPAKMSTQTKAGIVSLSVGAAGLVLGAATGAAVLGMHGTLESGCTAGRCPQSLVSKLDSYNTLGTVSSIGFIAGGVAAGLGVVLLVSAPKKEGATVGLVAGPTAGGGVLGAAGRF
jgi:hypothetical protein